jgi:hypothetical protein
VDLSSFLQRWTIRSVHGGQRPAGGVDETAKNSEREGGRIA